jgi:hypothetical protein
MEKMKISIDDLSHYKIENSSISCKGGKNKTKRKGDVGTTNYVDCADTKNSSTDKEEWNSCEEIFIHTDPSGPIDFDKMRGELEANGAFDTEYFNSLDLSNVKL